MIYLEIRLYFSTVGKEKQTNGFAQKHLDFKVIFVLR